MTVRTLGDRIAVKLLSGAGMIGLIIIPDVTNSTKNQTFTRARVMSSGPAVKRVKAGDTVLVTEYFGDEIGDNPKEQVRIGRERDIVGIIVNDGKPSEMICCVGDRVLMERIDEERRAGRILLPEHTVQPLPFKARVLSAGPGCAAVKLGNTVLVPKGKSVRVRFGLKEYELIEEGSLLTILED